jgi:hypothetical protein
MRLYVIYLEMPSEGFQSRTVLVFVVSKSFLLEYGSKVVPLLWTYLPEEVLAGGPRAHFLPMR